MASSQVIQGSWKEIASHAEEFHDRDDLVLIVPARADTRVASKPQINLAEAMKDYIGSIDLGDANLSENTGDKFAKLLSENYRKHQE